MADNYLEKQYESYEARKAAWLKAQKLGKYQKKRRPAVVSQSDLADNDNAENEQDGQLPSGYGSIENDNLADD